jgi:hypothetical protein
VKFLVKSKRIIHYFILISILFLFSCKNTSSDGENYPCPVYQTDLQNIDGITETNEEGIVVGNIDERDWYHSINLLQNDKCNRHVVLLSFSVSFFNSQLIVFWSTQSEYNNQGWNIYRAEADLFETAVKINANLIDGAGTTEELTEYSFIDETEIILGNTYFYWLVSVSFNNLWEIYGPVSIFIPNEDIAEPPDIPQFFAFGPAYPNPSSANVMIPVSLVEETFLTIIIIDDSGNYVTTLFSDTLPARNNYILWNTEGIEPGIYRCIYHENSTNHWHGDILIQ